MLSAMLLVTCDRLDMLRRKMRRRLEVMDVAQVVENVVTMIAIPDVVLLL